jgi:hypothetical protein
LLVIRFLLYISLKLASESSSHDWSYLQLRSPMVHHCSKQSCCINSNNFLLLLFMSVAFDWILFGTSHQKCYSSISFLCFNFLSSFAVWTSTMCFWLWS